MPLFSGNAEIVFSLPTTLVVGVETRYDDVMNCTANLGYPDSGSRDLRIEYKTEGGSTFQPFTLKTPDYSEPLTEPCGTPKELIYRQIIFTSAYNGSTFRCSIYENQASTTPVSSSEEKTVRLLQGTVCREI